MPHAGVSRFGTSIDAAVKKHPTLKPDGIGFLFHVSQSSSMRSAPTGYGCVGHVFDALSCGTFLSSIGRIGLPVSRSTTKRTPSVRIAAISLRSRPLIGVL